MKENKVIAVESSVNIAAVESLLKDIQTPGVCDVLLPTYLRKRLVGGDCSLIQFLITWSKEHPKGRLLTHVKHGENSGLQLPGLIDRDHGLVGALVASDVMTRKGEKSLRVEAESLAWQRLDRMDGSVAGASRGAKAFLLCVDHKDRGFPLLLYHTPPGARKTPKGEKDFQSLAGDLLKNTAQAFHADEPFEKLRFGLGTILHELFDNTDRWAKVEYDGRPLERSVRGIRFELYADRQNVLLSHVKDSPPLVDYLSHSEFSRASPGDARRRFVEMSIFDSGPGLAQRNMQAAIGSETALDKEYEAVIRCLSKYTSSSFRTHRGLGLHTVMKTLTSSAGFLRIRTGRLALFRDFVTHPYSPDGTSVSKEPFMMDWESRTRDTSPMQRVEGVLLTMLIPITHFV
jgi:hypothetical protein